MPDIHSIVRKINHDLSPQFEARLRAQLEHQSKEWLIEQIVRLSLDANSVAESDYRRIQEEKALDRAKRIERIKQVDMDRFKLMQFLAEHQTTDRNSLIKGGFLLKTA